MLGAELAAADGAELAAAVDAAADGDGDVELPAGLVSEAATALVPEAAVDGLFDAVATTMMTTSAPNAMSPVSTLWRAGQGLRFCPCGPCCPFGPSGVFGPCGVCGL